MNTPSASRDDIVLFIGLDWAKEKHDICLRHGLEGQVETAQIKHTPEALAAWMQSMQQRSGGGKVRVALEQSRGGLFNFLAEQPNVELCLPNPKTVARMRDAFKPSGAKDDPADASILCDISRFHAAQCPTWKAESETMQLVRQLTERRRGLVDDRTALVLQLQEELNRFYPLPLALFKDQLDAEIALAFLGKHPTLADAQEAKPQALREFFYAQRSRSEKLIQERIALIQSAKPLTTNRAVIKAGRMAVIDLVRRIRAAQEGVAEYDAAIKEAADPHPDIEIFRSLPGAGAALAPRLLALFGENRERFPSARDVQQYSGIAPVTVRSGKSCSVRSRRACSHFVKQTMHEFASSSAIHCQWAREYVHTQKAKGKTHNAAIRSLAFKWLRIIWRMWKSKTKYDEATYLQAMTKRQSPYRLEQPKDPRRNPCE